MAKPPSGAYREAMLAARAAQGRVSVETGKEIEKLLRGLATELDTKLADATRLGSSGRFVAQQKESRRIIGGLLRDFNVRLERAIADGRALAYEEVSEVWELATRKVAASTVQGAATGAVRIPSVNLYGTYNAVGAASNWRTLVDHSVSKFALEADAIVGESLANGLGGAELSRRMRSLVEGSEKFRDLFERVPDKLTGKLVSKVDLRKVSKEVRGGMAQMRYNADRIAFSEIGNARREAEVQAGLRDTSVKAYQWHLSPDRGSQEDPDECDVLEASDYYGLGPGVYPVDKVPPIPHPFDRCEIEPIPFSSGEVSGGAQRPLPDRRGGGLSGKFPPGMSSKAKARAAKNVDRLFDETDAVDLRSVVEKLPTVPPGTPPPPVPTPSPSRKLSVEDLGEDWVVRVYGGDGKPIQKRYISPNGKMYSSLKAVRRAVDDGLEELGSGSARFEDAVSKKKTPVGGRKKPDAKAIDDVAAAEAGPDLSRFEDPHGFGLKHTTRGAQPTPPGIEPPPKIPAPDVKAKKSLGGNYASEKAWREAGFDVVEEIQYYERGYSSYNAQSLDDWIKGGFTKAEIVESGEYARVSTYTITRSTPTEVRTWGSGYDFRRASQQANRKLVKETESFRKKYGLNAETARYEAVPDPPRFKRVKAAEDWLEEQYPGKAFDLAGMDVEIANGVAQEWVALAREFPTTAFEIRLIGTLSKSAKWSQVGMTKATRLGEGTYGVASARGFLGLSKPYYSDPRKILASKKADTTRSSYGTYRKKLDGDKAREAAEAGTGRLRSWNTARGPTESYEKLRKTNAAIKEVEDAAEESKAAIKAYFDTPYGETAAKEAARARMLAASKRVEAANDAVKVDPQYRAIASDYGKATLRHEFGHHIDFAYSDTSGYATAGTFRRWIPVKDLPDELQRFADARQFGQLWTTKVGKNLDAFADEVSIYGTKNRFEYWAEAANASKFGDEVSRTSSYVEDWKKIVARFTDRRYDPVDYDNLPTWGSLSVEERKRVAARILEVVDEIGVHDPGAYAVEKLRRIADTGVIPPY